MQGAHCLVDEAHAILILCRLSYAFCIVYLVYIVYLAYTVYYIRYFGIAYSPVKLALNATKKKKKRKKEGAWNPIARPYNNYV